MNQQIGNARSGGDIYMIAVLGPKGTFCDKSYEVYKRTSRRIKKRRFKKYRFIADQ